MYPFLLLLEFLAFQYCTDRQRSHKLIKVALWCTSSVVAGVLVTISILSYMY